MPIIPINSKFSLRFFTRVETANDCFRIFDIGIQSVDPKSDTPRVDSIVLPGYASQFHRTRPVSEIKADADKAITTDISSPEEKSKDPSPSEETEDGTPATPVTPEILNSDEKTSVDSTTEPEAQTRVETEAERIQREGEEAMDGNGDGTGHTYS